MKRDITEADLIEYLQTILKIEGEITLTEFKRRVRIAFDLSDHDLSILFCFTNLLEFKSWPRNHIVFT